MGNQTRIRLSDTIESILSKRASAMGIKKSEYAAQIISQFLTDTETEKFKEFEFVTSVTNRSNKVKHIEFTLQEVDIDSLDQLSEYFSLSKSKCISKLIRMYVRRELTTLNYQVETVESLTKSLMQLRGIGININQISTVLNKWIKESDYKNEPYPSEAREFIKASKILYQLTNDCVNRIENAINFGKYL